MDWMTWRTMGPWTELTASADYAAGADSAVSQRNGAVKKHLRESAFICGQRLRGSAYSRSRLAESRPTYWLQVECCRVAGWL